MSYSVTPPCRLLAAPPSVSLRRSHSNFFRSSSFLDKSNRPVAPRAGRRRIGGGAAETASQPSQPSTPLLSAASARSSVDPQPTHIVNDASQTLADESLLTRAAHDTSQAARDVLEASLQHQVQESLTSAGASSTSATVQPGSSTVTSAERPPRTERASIPPLALSNERAPSPQVSYARSSSTEHVAVGQQRFSDSSPIPPEVAARLREANEAARQAATTPSLDQERASPLGSSAANKRKRGVPISTTNKRLRTSDSTQATDEAADDVQPSIEETAQADQPPAKKPRKVRKDKGIPRKRKVDQAQVPAPTTDAEVTAPAEQVTRELRRRRTTTAPMEEAEAGAIEDEEGGDGEEEQEKPRKRRKRRATPEENERVEIDPKTAQMGDMCLPSRNGKVSNREKQMRKIDWAEVKRRRIAERTARPSGATNDDDAASQAAENEERIPPRQRRTQMVNGVATIVNGAMTIDRHAAADAELATLEVVEDDDLTRRITSHSFLDTRRRDPLERQYGRRKCDPWSAEETAAFYDALRMFGTDFFIISKMFPGKTRRHIKMKFVREEKDFPDSIKRALLGERVEMDLDVYSKATGITDWTDGDKVRAEMDEIERDTQEKIQEARARREEIEKQRRIAGDVDDENEVAGESTKENSGPGKTRKDKARKRKVMDVMAQTTAGASAGADGDMEIIDTFDD